MKKFESVVSTLLLTVALAMAPAFDAGSGGGDEPTIPDAQALIDKCWDMSLEKRSSGNTSRMRSGHLDTVLCLERVVLDQVEIMFPGVREQNLSREVAQEKLRQLRFAVGGLYWAIYNGHKGCGISCGTIYYTFHLPPISRVLEDMIRAMIDVRNRYDY